MFTGPVGPVEVFFYWPNPVLGNFYWPGAIGSPLASSPVMAVSTPTMEWLRGVIPKVGCSWVCVLWSQCPKWYSHCCPLILHEPGNCPPPPPSPTLSQYCTEPSKEIVLKSKYFKFPAEFLGAFLWSGTMQGILWDPGLPPWCVVKKWCKTNTSH